jgi:hypothetical protein
LWEELLNPWALTPGPDPYLQLWMHKFYGGLLSYLVLYGLILLVNHVLDAREQLAFQQTETARLNEQLSKSQLSALRRQIEPHFLFNTLNAIAGLVREKRNDAAVSMIVGLSDFLRRVVEDSDRQQVPLGEELEFTQTYLDIQKVRFAERLQFSVDAPQDLLTAQVPSLMLQPMVENAVKHGIARRVQGGAIRITASRSNGNGERTHPLTKPVWRSVRAEHAKSATRRRRGHGLRALRFTPAFRKTPRVNSCTSMRIPQKYGR